MAELVKIPRLLIAETSPDASLTWVVHSYDPFLIARVDPIAINGMRLICWPSSVQKNADDQELLKIISSMGEFWSEEIKHHIGLPSRWAFAFDDNMMAPEHMVCDNEQEDFTGILRLKPPQMWLIPHRRDHRQIFAVAGPEGSTPTEEAIKESWNWWLDYCEQEDALPPERDHFDE